MLLRPNFSRSQLTHTAASPQMAFSWIIKYFGDMWRATRIILSFFKDLTLITVLQYKPNEMSANSYVKQIHVPPAS